VWVLIFCWYHNSSQPAFKASATSTAGPWRRFGRQQLRDAGHAGLAAPKRCLQRGQHGNIVFFANLPDRLYHNRVGLTDDEDLAAEILSDNDLENFADIDPVDTHAEHDQVGLVGLQHARQIAGLTAFRRSTKPRSSRASERKQTKVLFCCQRRRLLASASGAPKMRCARILAKN